MAVEGVLCSGWLSWLDGPSFRTLAAALAAIGWLTCCVFFFCRISLPTSRIDAKNPSAQLLLNKLACAVWESVRFTQGGALSSAQQGRAIGRKSERRGRDALRTKGKATLFLILALLLVPAGFAVGQVADGDLPFVSQGDDHSDPDPGTDPVQRLNALRQAAQEGDSAAEKAAADAVRDEILSRMPSDEQEAARNAPKEANVPDGTVAYIPPTVPTELVESCERALAADPSDKLCSLIVLNSEGKAEPGAYSQAEVERTLEEAK